METLDVSSPPPTTEGSTDPSLSRNASFSKLNAKAPEFVPVRTGSGRSDGQQQQQESQSHPQPPPQKIVMSVTPPGMVHMYPGPNAFVPIQNHHHHHHHHHPGQYHHGYDSHRHPHNQFYAGGGGRGDGGGYRDQEQEVEVQQLPIESHDHAATSKNLGPSEEVIQKVVNQVEYYFSDLNLATTDHLMRFINKDPEGYVPMSVVASFKKIKTFTSHSQIASILRHSTKLVVSEDGNKVKRLHPFTEADLEELQSRIVIAENLPEDHCYQNLMRLFSAVGNVKNIRTCQPQPNNGGSSSASRSAKADSMHISNKLHAFVEYETIELAEKAVADLNNDGNWRSGLRVKFFPRHTSKAAHARVRKGHDGEGHNEEENVDHQPIDKALENTSGQSDEQVAEENVNDREGPKKGRGRGRGKGRGRGQPHHHNNRGNHQLIGAPNNHTSNDHPTVTKQPPGPRMPDGTKGFTMGRGKPVAEATSQ